MAVKDLGKDDIDIDMILIKDDIDMHTTETFVAFILTYQGSPV